MVRDWNPFVYYIHLDSKNTDLVLIQMAYLVCLRISDQLCMSARSSNPGKRLAGPKNLSHCKSRDNTWDEMARYRIIYVYIQQYLSLCDSSQALPKPFIVIKRSNMPAPRFTHCENYRQASFSWTLIHSQFMLQSMFIAGDLDFGLTCFSDKLPHSFIDFQE